MKVDLSREFEGIENTEFDGSIQKQEYVMQKMLEAMSGVVPAVYDWCLGVATVGSVIEDLPQFEMESFLALGLINKLVERERMLFGSKILAAQIRKLL